jgi:CMP-N,N'-diacetyllegionaminic acid synthase
VIDGLRVLALIPARGGSKGLPGKNLLPVKGRPLLAYSVAAAQGARCIDRTVLSSEDEEIIAAALTYGCEVPFRRPARLATDRATSIDVVLHALDQLPGNEVIVLLQPTSPLRSSADIDAACACFAASGAPSCVSVSAVQQSPYWMYRLGERNRLRPIIAGSPGASRRQELPEVYALNGAIYVARVDWLRRSRNFVGEQTVAYVMPTERSIDIDSRADYEAFLRTVGDA